MGIADADLRRVLAEAACKAHHPYQQAGMRAVPGALDPRHQIAACYGCIRAAAALLPVVHARARRVAADELRAAAQWLTTDAPDETTEGISWSQNVADEDTALAWATSSLHDRADALRGDQ